jgi:hypothetical protein
MNKMILSPLTILLLINLAACKNKIKDAADMPTITKDMKATTKVMSNDMKDMKKTTQYMADTTTRMEKSAIRMKKNTETMYLQQRPKSAQETRDRSFQRVMQMKSFEQKVTQAMVYHGAFEYQLWTARDVLGDTKERREELYHTATREYFRSVLELMNEIVEPMVISPATKDSTELSLFAISVSMHMVHDAQKKLIKDKKIEKVHMMKLIGDALQKLGPLNDETIEYTDLKEHEKEILNNEKEAKTLLALRFKMLPAMILKKVSNIKEKFYYDFFGIRSKLHKLNFLRKEWPSKFPELNISQQALILLYAREAIRTQEVMRSIGMEAELDANVKKVLKNMTIPATNAKSGSARQANIADFDSLMSKLLK